MFEFDLNCGPRSHGMSLRAPTPRTDLGLHSLSYRTSRVRNKLSPNTVKRGEIDNGGEIDNFFQNCGMFTNDENTYV